MKAEKSHITTPFERLRAIVAADLLQVNALILDMVRSQAALIPAVSEHTVKAGGKRLRPILTLAAAKLCDYEGSAHIALATAVEFIHTATLLHDDVVDSSQLRRGKKTANHVWGNKESILVGDFLLAKAFNLMGRAESLEIYEILSHAAVVISEGEVLQLQNEKNIGLTLAQYLKVVTAKTAALFAAACEVGAVIARRPEAEQRALHEYGLNLGIAFQIVDDAMDYAASSDTMGKNAGNDFIEGKVTLPVMLAYAEASPSEKTFLEQVFEKQERNEADLAGVIDCINKNHSIKKSLDKAKDYIHIATQALDIFPESAIRQHFMELSDFIIERNI